MLVLALSLSFAADTCDRAKLSIRGGTFLQRLQAQRPGEDCEVEGNQDRDSFWLDSRDPDCDEELRRQLDACGLLDDAYPEGFSGTWAPIPGFTPGDATGGTIEPLRGDMLQVVETPAGPVWVGQGGELPPGVLVFDTEPETVEAAVAGATTQVLAAFQLTEGVGEGAVAITADHRPTGLTIGLLDDATGLQWTAGPGAFVAPVLE